MAMDEVLLDVVEGDVDLAAKKQGMEDDTEQDQAWKVVGSPARRASINPDSNPIDEDMRSFLRTRNASMSNVSFSSDAPPGLANGLGYLQEEGWSNSNGPINVPSIWTNGAPIDIHDNFSQGNLGVGGSLGSNSNHDFLDGESPKQRSRSKSAVFGIEDGLQPPPNASIWSSPSPSLHRRASTQPSQQTLMWEALRAAQLATPNDLNGANADDLVQKYRGEQIERRLSVAPSMVNRNVDQEPNLYDMNRRRHSMAGPSFDRKLNTKYLSEGFEALGLDDASNQLEKIDDYFENTSSRAKAFMEAGKNLQANQEVISPVLKSTISDIGNKWPLFVVEFKAGRTDYFYLSDDSSKCVINVGDLAIVEADRGKDLGKVIETQIHSLAELQAYQATHVDPLVDSHNAVGKEIHPKRIFRVAEPSEVALLLAKGQDENKANALCQIKIRQKKLPMEIVDAEYQWDRRKLTFYFVAERRIDFRELVRELFKIYKTRIWM